MIPTLDEQAVEIVKAVVKKEEFEISFTMNNIPVLQDCKHHLPEGRQYQDERLGSFVQQQTMYPVQCSPRICFKK